MEYADPNPSALAFYNALRQLALPSACADLFRSAIAPFGFDTFACGEIDLGDRDRRVFHIIDWPLDWRDFYLKSGMIDRDPLIDALAIRDSAFTWSDLRVDRKLPPVGREALDRVAAAGWIEGIVVPLRLGHNHTGLVSMAGHRTGLGQPAIDYLFMIGAMLHNHIRTLVSREGFAVPPMNLTDREIACVRLVARGMADSAIADAMGIASSTAHEFVEKAKRRLKVRSRAELIAVAVAYCIIDL